MQAELEPCRLVQKSSVFSAAMTFSFRPVRYGRILLDLGSTRRFPSAMPIPVIKDSWHSLIVSLARPYSRPTHHV